MKSKIKKDKTNNWFDFNDLLISLSMTPQQRMSQLEQLNAFLDRAMPKESKEMWKKLKAEGF